VDLDGRKSSVRPCLLPWNAGRQLGTSTQRKGLGKMQGYWKSGGREIQIESQILIEVKAEWMEYNW
jgi:hypothetical protein